MEDMPGFLINGLDNRPQAGPTHTAISNLMNQLNAEIADLPDIRNGGVAPNLQQVNGVLDAMEFQYKQWDPSIGPKVGTVMRQWFRSKGVGS